VLFYERDIFLSFYVHTITEAFRRIIADDGLMMMAEMMTEITMMAGAPDRGAAFQRILWASGSQAVRQLVCHPVMQSSVCHPVSLAQLRWNGSNWIPESRSSMQYPEERAYIIIVLYPIYIQYATQSDPARLCRYT